MSKRKTFIDIELDWAEKQLESWKQYIDNNPINELRDRIEWKDTANGRVPTVIATIEQQGKFIQETMKNYIALLKEVDDLRALEESKKEARGSSEIPFRMKNDK